MVERQRARTQLAGQEVFLNPATGKSWHDDQRQRVLRAYDRGEIQHIVNVAVLTEGWDCQPVSCVVLLRPSSHISTMIQMVGRGLRIVNPEEYPGVVKTDCVVLDFGTQDFESIGEKKGPLELPRRDAAMEENPTLKIEIQGHICCDTENKYGYIAEARAKAVYSYLISHKIDRKRLSFKGYGATRPIYKIPERNAQEEDGNRRVEIMVVER